MKLLLCRFFLFTGACSNATVRTLIRERYWVVNEKRWTWTAVGGKVVSTQQHFIANITELQAVEMARESGGTHRRPTLRELWTVTTWRLP